MKDIDFENHPIQIAYLLANTHIDVVFEFSKYQYSPQSILDERIIFNVSGNQLNDRYINSVLSDLNTGEELAFHSRIKIGEKYYHIPMIDFSCSEFDSYEYDVLWKLLPKKIFKELQIYKSGRSFHGYSVSLIKPRDLSGYLGRLLLCNVPEKKRIIDERWVGHRLMAGYTSLRLSCNTQTYLQLPERINFTKLAAI